MSRFIIDKYPIWKTIFLKASVILTIKMRYALILLVFKESMADLDADIYRKCYQMARLMENLPTGKAEASDWATKVSLSDSPIL